MNDVDKQAVDEITELQARVKKLKTAVAELETTTPLRGQPLWRLCNECEGVFCCAGAYFLNRETYQVRHCPFCGSRNIKEVPPAEIKRMSDHRMRAH